ncbi:MAG: hypothetical protein ACI8P0_005571 [Planctomycetaceae bacterium]
MLRDNQLTLMAVLVLYSAASIYTTLTDPNPYAAELTGMPEVEASLSSLSDLYTTVAIGFYGAMIIFSMIFQGLHALYYSRLKMHLSQHVGQTPAWVLELQRMCQSPAVR